MAPLLISLADTWGPNRPHQRPAKRGTDIFGIPKLQADVVGKSFGIQRVRRGALKGILQECINDGVTFATLDLNPIPARRVVSEPKPDVRSRNPLRLASNRSCQRLFSGEIPCTCSDVHGREINDKCRLLPPFGFMDPQSIFVQNQQGIVIGITLWNTVIDKKK